MLAGDETWHVPSRKPDYLLTESALSPVFRGKFMQALSQAHRGGQIQGDPQGEDQAWRARQRALYRHNWVVYAKTPLGGPAQVLEYLSRYTHRTAIGNQRIRAISDTQVAFTVRADDHGGKRLERLTGAEFISRLMQHVLPTGIKRIRHYGVLASACKGVKLDAARAALADARAQHASAGVGPGFHGAGGAHGCAAVSVLQTGEVALRGDFARSALPAGAGPDDGAARQSWSAMNTGSR